MYQLLILFTLFLMPSASFAHAGHDHGDLMSGFNHLIWLVPLAIVAIFIGWQLKKSIFVSSHY